jgi:hypothetical protein
MREASSSAPLPARPGFTGFLRTGIRTGAFGTALPDHF